MLLYTQLYQGSYMAEDTGLFAVITKYCDQLRVWFLVGCLLVVGSKFRPINEPSFWTENVHSNAQDNRYVQGNKLHRGECVLHTPGNWRCQSVWANSCLATDSSPLLSAHHVDCCTDALVLACSTPRRSRCVVLSAHVRCPKSQTTFPLLTL